MNKKQTYLFNRFILAHLHLWVSKSTDDESITYTPEFAYRLRTAGFNSKAINGFNDSEVDLIKKLGVDPDFEELKKKEISLLVMALQIAKLWTEDIPKEDRPNINISDKKMIVGKKHYVMELLKMKVKGSSIYDDQKAIVEETAVHALLWYNYVHKYIQENYHE